MPKFRFVSVLLCSGAIIAAPKSVHAQFTTYTDLTTYLAAVLNPATDTFDDLPLGFFPTPILNRPVGPYQYSASLSPAGNPDGCYNVGTLPDVWLSTVENPQVITFSGFSPSVRGFAANFFGTDPNGDFFADVSIILTATNVGGTVTHTLVNPTTSTFYAFVSASAITSVTVEVQQVVNEFNFPTVNNLTLATVTAVPESNTIALVAAGLVAMAVFARRRRVNK